ETSAGRCLRRSGVSTGWRAGPAPTGRAVAGGVPDWCADRPTHRPWPTAGPATPQRKLRLPKPPLWRRSASRTWYPLIVRFFVGVGRIATASDSHYQPQIGWLQGGILFLHGLFSCV